MASKTIKLDTFSKLKRWVEKHQGQGVTLDGVLNWLEHDPHGIPLKSSVAHVLVRDLASKGTPEDLEELQARGYDLRAKCTHQVDGNALHSAAQHNKKANALALIAMGLDPGQRLYANGPSALDEALINGHLSLFEALRPHGPVQENAPRQLEPGRTKRPHTGFRPQVFWPLHPNATESGPGRGGPAGV